MSGHDVSTYTDPRGPAHAVDTTHAAGAEAPDAVSSVQHPFSIKGKSTLHYEEVSGDCSTFASRPPGRVVVKRLLEAGKAMIGQEVVVGGWVKTGRKQGKDTFAFLEVNDGSSMENAQLMVTAETYDITKLVVRSSEPCGAKKKTQPSLNPLLDRGRRSGLQ